MYSRLYRFYFYWPILLLVGLVLSCQKTEVKDDPCAGLMSEGPLKQIGVIFIDKETGEYLVETTDKEASGINVIEAHTGEPFKNWNIYYHPENPTALNGVVTLNGIPTTEGDHSYNIRLDGFGAVTLSYTVVKGENDSDSPCIPRYYGITDVRIDDHSFDVFEHEDGTIISNALLVKL